MTIPELIKLIKQWAIDRGLNKHGTVEGQLIKTAEEVAELIIAISKDDVEAIKDAVGDVFVTLVVGNMLDKKLDVLKMIDAALTNSKMRPRRKIDLVHFMVHWLRGLLNFECYEEFECWRMIECLFDVCDWYELDFVECVESAYVEIAGRKGKIVDGSFVKE